VNVAVDPSSLQYDHFKELGRFISVDLKEDKVKSELRKRFLDDMEKVENSGVNGLCKLFLYQHFVVPRLSWAFLVHDFSLSFASELEVQATRRLKMWSGLYRSADVGTLYRQREHLGLQLTGISFHYQHMQIVRCCLLSSSQDPKVKDIFSRKQQRVNSFAHRWSGPKALSQLEPVVDHYLRFAGQTDHSGLGSQKGLYFAHPSINEVRAKTAEVLGRLQEEKLVTHASCLVQQGAWTHWKDVRPFDLSWRNLIYGPGPRVISFVLNAQINSVKTPAMLKLWGYTTSSQCPLCSQPKATLHHIIVNCDVGLRQGRYTWRHDSVLSNIEPALKTLVADTNQRQPLSGPQATLKNLYRSFVPAGKERPPKSQPKAKQGLLSSANDWSLLVDYTHENIVYPPVICASLERPDAVIWSCKSRTVVLLELTCCAEEGQEAAQLRKENRYFKLLNDSKEQGWRAELLTIEIGARGLIGNSTWRAFVKLGLSSQEATALCRRLSEVVARCSLAICQAQNIKEWTHKDLIGPLSPA